MQTIKLASVVLAFVLSAAWPLGARAGFEIGVTTLANGGTYNFAYGGTSDLRSVGSDATPFNVQVASSDPGVFQGGAPLSEGAVVVFFAYTNLVFAGVGSSNVTLTRLRRGDNAVLEQITITINVTPAPLTITVNNATRTFSAANPAFSVSYSGFVNGDTAASLTTTPTFSTAATPASPPGSYPVTASGAVNANYTISYVAGALAIVAAAVTAVPLGGPWMAAMLCALLVFTAAFSRRRHGRS